MIIGGWRGPGWQVFDADPRLGSQIRGWIGSAIGGHGCPVDAADAALVVSELFGNAVRHGPAGGRVLVGYCLWQQGARLVVCDSGGPGTPRLVHGGEFTEGGRGLRVVDSLAARWGSFRLAGALAVWCDFGQPLHAAASDAWAWLHLVLSVCDLSASGRPVAAVMPGTLAAWGHDEPAARRSRGLSSSRTGDPMTGDVGSRRPNAGRIYNFLLGGKDNYEQDRQAAGQLLALVPDARAAARANRHFLARAVRFLAEDSGIGQFIDIGVGLPAPGNLHQVARELDPLARVAYVDNDPVVVSHARALLCTAPGVCAVEGDLRDPPGIVGHPDLPTVIDLGEPAAIVLGAVLHHVPDEDSPHKLVDMLMAAVAPGSYLVISHATGEDIGADVAGQVRELYAQASAPVVFRSRAEVTGFFEGLELVPPGIADVAAWHADPAPGGPGRVIVVGGVGRKP